MGSLIGSNNRLGTIDRRHPYPLARSGGLFLVLIGIGIIVDVFLSGAFIIGTISAILSLMFAKFLSAGRPSWIQVIALSVAIILEIVLFIILFNVLPPTTSSVKLAWILMIVGLHFLPMAVTFGPRFGIVGVLCMANALAWLISKNVPLELFIVIDGTLKVGFGGWLFKKP